GEHLDPVAVRGGDERLDVAVGGAEVPAVAAVGEREGEVEVGHLVEVDAARPAAEAAGPVGEVGDHLEAIVAAAAAAAAAASARAAPPRPPPRPRPPPPPPPARPPPPPPAPAAPAPPAAARTDGDDERLPALGRPAIGHHLPAAALQRRDVESLDPGRERHLV